MHLFGARRQERLSIWEGGRPIPLGLVVWGAACEALPSLHIRTNASAVGARAPHGFEAPVGGESRVLASDRRAGMLPGIGGAAVGCELAASRPPPLAALFCVARPTMHACFEDTRACCVDCLHIQERIKRGGPPAVPPLLPPKPAVSLPHTPPVGACDWIFEKHQRQEKWLPLTHESFLAERFAYIPGGRKVLLSVRQEGLSTA
jgi:hypothetical protein